MIRKIIHIDRDKCNGCGACARACHEGAIDIIDGKAVLVREHFCDGLGDCLPACPTDAITFEEREAPAYEAGTEKALFRLSGNACQTVSAKHCSRSRSSLSQSAFPVAGADQAGRCHGTLF